MILYTLLELSNNQLWFGGILTAVLGSFIAAAGVVIVKVLSRDNDKAVAAHVKAQTDATAVTTMKEAMIEVSRISADRGEQVISLTAKVHMLSERLDRVEDRERENLIAHAAHEMWDKEIWAFVKLTNPEFPPPPPIRVRALLENEIDTNEITSGTNNV